MNSSFKEIWKKIEGSENFVLSLHFGPDGDSLGSCAAMKYVLEKMGKKVNLISRDYLDETLMALEYSKEIGFGKSLDELDLNKFDLILMIDSGSKKQFVKEGFVFPENLFLINIDHHETNDYYGNMNYVDAKRPSACSVLLDFFREVGVEIDKDLATRLLLGIYTDSGFFSHDNGNSIKDAAFLIDCGADYLNGIVNKIKYNYPLRLKKYYGCLYERFRIEKVGKLNVGYTYSNLKDLENLGLNLSEVRGGANDLQEIGGVDILFVLSEIDGLVKGSFRSRKGIDVSLLAKELGGGGHKGAAAFKLEKMSIEEAEKKVLEVIEKKFNYENGKSIR